MGLVLAVAGCSGDKAAHHYDTTFSLGLTANEKADLVEYLKSL